MLEKDVVSLRITRAARQRLERMVEQSPALLTPAGALEVLSYASAADIMSILIARARIAVAADPASADAPGPAAAAAQLAADGPRASGTAPAPGGAPPAPKPSPAPAPATRKPAAAPQQPRR